MNKKEFKELDREQMIIAFNQLKDDYSSLFNQLEKEKEKNKELNEALERSSGRVTELTVENSDLKYQIYHKQQIIDIIKEQKIIYKIKGSE